MKLLRSAAIASLVVVGMPALAHRLDEYLQATTLTIERDGVLAQVRLTPGVAVFPMVLAGIDGNADGVLAESERQAYADKVVRDLSLSIDGLVCRMRLVSRKFPSIEEMREGRGEIQLDVRAEVAGAGSKRRLRFENHHQSRIAAYLVNSLVPPDPGIRVVGQKRNYEQSVYEVEYTQGGLLSEPFSSAWWSGGRGWVGAGVLLLVGRVALLWRERRRLATDGRQYT